MSSLREAHPKGLDFTTWKRPNAVGRGAEKKAKPYDLLPCHVANVPEGWGLGQSPNRWECHMVLQNCESVTPMIR